MKRKSGNLLMLALASLFVLSACGGGGSSSGTPPATPPATSSSAAGIWIGTFTSNVTHITSSATGHVAETNSARFGLPDTLAQYSGVLNVSDNSFSTTATAYAPHGSTLLDGSQVGTVILSGTFTPKDKMSGTYNGAGDEGTFTLTYNASLYERPSALPMVSGIWKGKILDFTNLISINDDGAIVEINSTGCTYVGLVSVIDPLFNIYSVHLDIDTCGNDNGTYDGLAALSDTSAANDTFTTIMSSPTLAGGFQLRSVPGPVESGPNISANPNPLAFGSVTVGSNSDKTLTVSNSGNADLTLGTINISGPGFSINGGTCTGRTLAVGPGNSCTIIARFAPANAGASAGTLAITSDDPKTPSLAVSLTGTGTSGSGGGVDLVVASLSGQKSVDNNVAFPVSVTVKNQGSAAGAGFTVKGYFSVDTVPGNGGTPADKLLFTWNVPGLAAGATASNSFSSKFTGFPIHHPYYVVVKVDADDQVAEANETNNVADYSTYVSR